MKNIHIIECTHTRDIVCPYCSYIRQDSYECCPNEEDFDMICDQCEKEFSVNRYIEVTYSTKQIKIGHD